MPFWGFAGFRGGLYSADARPGDFLGQYAEVFNAVEGNTTFYSVPSVRTLERWVEQTPATFRFCPKLPRRVTHELCLGPGALDEALTFVEHIERLGERLGPLMVQLPPTFAPAAFARLERLLRGLPEELPVAVELRHPGFYGSPDAPAAGAERRVAELLAELSIDRVIIDARPMRAGDLGHPDVQAAEHKKPDLPVRPMTTARRPLLRFIGHPDAPVNEPFLQRWATVTAAWLRGGLEPYIFIHCPNNVHSPPLARRFHDLLRAQLAASDQTETAVDVGELPSFPAETRDRAGQLVLL